MMARLGLVALGILGALALAEGLVRVAAAFDPRVRVLATGRATRRAVTYATLEQFVAAQAAHITPHRRWYNYWSNAFGFHDEEFVEPKPAGRRRVLVVGDSFTFGPVPYPQGVVTLAEEGLRTACPGRDLDLLNMGLMGAGPPEYRILAELGVPRFAPDLVLVALFLGNDPPDIHRYVHDRSPMERLLRHSRLWTFGKNFIRARSGLREGDLPARVSAVPPDATFGRGGTRVEGTTELAPDDAALVGPLLTDRAYQTVLASDLGRFYRPPSERDLRIAWQQTLANLDAVHRIATRAGSGMALALLPSVLQVDSALRATTVTRVGGSLRYGGLSAADIDPDLPNAMFRQFAATRGIPLVDLTPVFIAEAPATEPLYKRNDNHWTPRGNRRSGPRARPVSGAARLCRAMTAWLRPVAYVVLVCLLLFAATEGLLRVWYPAPARYYVWPPGLRVDFATSDAATPGVTGPARFRTNSLGLRSDEPPADARRVVYVFGGSTAADLYLDQEEAWVQRVQTGLNRVPGQPRTWVGNLARPSLASIHNVIHFDRLLPELPRADLLVDLVGVNDLQLALKSSYIEPTPERNLDWAFALRPPEGGVAGRLATVRAARFVWRTWQQARLGFVQTRDAAGYARLRECRQTAPPRISSTSCPTSRRPSTSTAGISGLSPRAPARTAPRCCS